MKSLALVGLAQPIWFLVREYRDLSKIATLYYEQGCTAQIKPITLRQEGQSQITKSGVQIAIRLRAKESEMRGSQSEAEVVFEAVSCSEHLVFTDTKLPAVQLDRPISESCRNSRFLDGQDVGARKILRESLVAFAAHGDI
mmetsp:Transcript_464/g.881  ORF Transcript_464/g.881 Transcript_464/m.881 type:complete len:141 (+) Transcript_464:726-1148(+)